MAEDVRIQISTKADGTGAKQAQKDIQNVGDQTEKAGEQAKKAAFNFGEFAKNAGLGATAILGTLTAGIGFGAKVAGDLEAARNGFVALLGSAEKADEVMSRVKQEAASTPFEIPGLVAGAQALTAVTKDGNKAIDVLMDVGAAVATSGKGQAELDRVILNLQQIASTGKLTAMDIRQFQGAIPIFNDIVAGIGMTTSELQDADNAAELLFLAFQKAASEGGITAEGFTSQAGTFNQLVSNLQDNLTIMASDLITNSGLFDILKDAIAGVNDFLSYLAPKLIEFANWAANNQPVIAAIAGVIGGLLVAAITAAVVAFGPMILAAMAFAAAGAAIGVAIQFVLPYIMQLWDAVDDTVFGIAESIRAFIEKHIPAFQAFWDVVKGIFTFALGFLKGFIETTWQGIAQFLKGIWEIIAGIFQIALGVLIVIFGVFQGIFTGDWNKAWNTIKLGFEDIWNGIKSFFKGILDALIGYLKTFVNGFIGIINGMISGVNSVASKIPGAEGVSIPLIPHLARGVDDFAGGVALVGEKGPELVTLPRHSSVIPNDKLGQAGVGATVYQTNHIYTPIDMEAMNRDLAFAVANR